MTAFARAFAVHLLTATGAVFAMLALIEAVQGDFAMMFVWLVVAFAVDGIDGPLARRYRVDENAPQWDGVLLDLIIDYLTYVFIPAYALYASGILSGITGWIALFLIVFTAALYFADTRMKTGDNSFSGFPGCWNMVAIVFFAIEPGGWVALGVVAALAVAQFLPIRFVHPWRTRRWRWISLPAAFLWTGFAGWAAWVDFDPRSWAQTGLVVTSLWLLSAGLLQQLFGLGKAVGRKGVALLRR